MSISYFQIGDKVKICLFFSSSVTQEVRMHAAPLFSDKLVFLVCFLSMWSRPRGILLLKKEIMITVSVTIV